MFVAVELRGSYYSLKNNNLLKENRTTNKRMICSKCKTDTAPEKFTNKYGKQCKTCDTCRNHAKEMREKNKESRKLYQKCRQEKNKDNKEIDVFYARKSGDNTQEWQRFTTQKELATKLGLYASNVNKVISGKLRTTGGYEMKVEKEKIKADAKDWGSVKKENNIVDKRIGKPSQHRKKHETIDNVVGKKCSHCKNWRPLEQYNYSKSHWDNLRVECKPCLSERRNANKEKMTEYNKQYWEKTKEKQKEKNKQWRENNQEQIKQNMRKWLEKNREYKKQKDREYRLANWERKKKIQREWMLKNYHDMKNNPERSTEFSEYKIKHNTSRRIRELLGQNKSERCLHYVGCDLYKLRIHLETQFTDGMHWKNYGESPNGEKKYAWQIDHRIPCNAFDLTNPIEQMACFHYKNLQPLWWDDNITKQHKFDPFDKKNYLQKFIEIYILP